MSWEEDALAHRVRLSLTRPGKWNGYESGEEQDHEIAARIGPALNAEEWRVVLAAESYIVQSDPYGSGRIYHKRNIMKALSAWLYSWRGTATRVALQLRGMEVP